MCYLTSDSKKKKKVETLTKQVNSIFKGQKTTQRITLGEGSQSQGGLMVRKGGSHRWTGPGGQGLTHKREESLGHTVFSMGSGFFACLNPAIPCLFVPKIVTQKALKNHPKFFTSSMRLKHGHEMSMGSDRCRLPRLSSRGPPLRSALSPCQPGDGHTTFQPCLFCVPYSYFLDTNHTKF